MFQNDDQGVQTNCTLHLFPIFWLLLCSDCILDLIKKLELCLTVVSVLLKIRFGHAQVSVPKIGIQMSKTACTNSLHVFQFRILYILTSHQENLFFTFSSRKSSFVHMKRKQAYLYIFRKLTLLIKVELQWSQNMIRFNIISNFYISMYPVYY